MGRGVTRPATGSAPGRPGTIAATVALVLGGMVPGAVVPAGAAEVWVDPAHAMARDAGPGTASAPWRTLTHALQHLQPGDHLRIAAGTYREALRLPRRKDWGMAATPTIIEGQGLVLIKGSRLVRGWQALDQGRFAIDWPRESAQVFIDGQALQQIGGTLFGGTAPRAWWPGRRNGAATTLRPGEFIYDVQARRLIVSCGCMRLDDHQVEVSVAPVLLEGRDLAQVVVRNLSFMHGNATPTQRGGLVQMAGQHLWLDQIRVTQADGVGIELIGDDNRLTRSVANDNGQLGIRARGTRVRLADNTTNGNNTRGFQKWWEAGGAKFVGAGGLRDSVVTGHVALGNFGDGLWFDWGNADNRIIGNTSAFNHGMGIHYEASSGATVTDNLVVGNRQRGIYAPHSRGLTIAWNLVAHNGLEGIAVIDEGRRDTRVPAPTEPWAEPGATPRFAGPSGPTPSGVPPLDLRPADSLIAANVVAWNGGAIVLPDEASRRAARIQSDANLLVGPPAATTLRGGWHGPARTLAAWQQRTRQDSHSLIWNAPADAPDLERTLAWFNAVRSRLPTLTLEPLAGLNVTALTVQPAPGGARAGQAPPAAPRPAHAAELPSAQTMGTDGDPVAAGAALTLIPGPRRPPYAF